MTNLLSKTSASFFLLEQPGYLNALSITLNSQSHTSLVSFSIEHETSKKIANNDNLFIGYAYIIY